MRLLFGRNNKIPQIDKFGMEWKQLAKSLLRSSISNGHFALAINLSQRHLRGKHSFFRLGQSVQNRHVRECEIVFKAQPFVDASQQESEYIIISVLSISQPQYANGKLKYFPHQWKTKNAVEATKEYRKLLGF